MPAKAARTEKKVYKVSWSSAERCCIVNALYAENMFCARCGQQIPDASELCPLCGREATLALIPQPAPDALAQPQFTLPSFPIAHGPKGVGGWLLFYCLSLTTLGPALVLLGYWFTFRLHGFNPRMVLNTAHVLYEIVVGIFLWTRRPAALALLKIYFIVVAAETLMLMLEAVNLALRIHSSVSLSSSLSSLMASAGITLLWFVYFRKSVRVKNTYGANL